MMAPARWRAWIRKEKDAALLKLAAEMPTALLLRTLADRGWRPMVATADQDEPDEQDLDLDKIDFGDLERAAAALRDGHVDEALHQLTWALWDVDFAFRRLAEQIRHHFNKGSTP